MSLTASWFLPSLMTSMIKPGLEQTILLLDALGNPHLNFKSVHVAGTNGKGSCCCLLRHGLVASGFKTGTFTSPHFLTQRDSIRINNQVVSQQAYDNAYNQVTTANTTHCIQASLFELLTVTCFVLFAQFNVEIAVIEVGMGGRLDATNVIPAPLIAVLMPIALDHTFFLGSTIESIARHKAGIIKPSCIVVVAQQVFAQATDVIVFEAKQKSCSIAFAKPATLSEDGTASVQWKGSAYLVPISLVGDHQLVNLGAAVQVLEILESQGWHIPPSCFTSLEHASLPGRLEWITLANKTRFLLDGSHNILGAELLAKYVNSVRVNGEPVSWIYGFTHGKDISGVLSQLVQKGDILYTVGFEQPEGMPWIKCATHSEISDAANSLQLKCTEVNNLAKLLGDLEGFKVVCGSLYLVAQVYRTLGLFDVSTDLIG